MRLSNKAMEELVREVAGKDTVALVELIKNKQNVSEFKLAEKLKITVNEARNMLYRLHAHNLVSFTRKKDKKKGWYIYYWTFDHEKARDLILNLKRKKLVKLRETLKAERGGNFFSCPNKCVRVGFEGAMEDQFRCPECNQVMVQEDNSKKIERLQEEIKEIEDELRFKKIEKPEIIREVKKKPIKKKIKKKPKRRAKKKVKKVKKIKKRVRRGRPVKRKIKKKAREKPRKRKVKRHKKVKKRRKELPRKIKKKRKAKKRIKKKAKKRRKR